MSRNVLAQKLCAWTLAALTLMPAIASAQDALARLKGEALDLDQAARALIEERVAGETRTVTFYVSSQTPKLVMRQITVQVDDQPKLTYEYSEMEAESLSQSAMHKLAALNLEPGPHRIKGDFLAKPADARPGTPRVRGLIDLTFDKAASPMDIDLTLSEQGMLRAEPVMKLRSWSAR